MTPTRERLCMLSLVVGFALAVLVAISVGSCNAALIREAGEPPFIAAPMARTPTTR